MANLSEKDIDYIFQEGSKKHEFPFKESAWDNMEVLLDSQERRRKYAYASICLLTLFIGSFAAYTIFNPDANTPIKKNVDYTPKVIATNTNDSQNDVKEINDLITTDYKSEVGVNDLSSTKNINSAANKYLAVSQDNIPSTKNHIVSNKQTISPTPVKKINSKLNNPAKLINPSNFVSSNALSSSPYVEMNAVENGKDKIGGIIIETLPAVAAISTLQMAQVKEETSKELPLAKVIDNNKLSRLRFGIIAGKEWSISSSSIMSNGYRFGAELAYRLNSKLQLTTGVIFSKKIYETKGENYIPSDAAFLWVNNVVPETVSGSNSVFEIPLELNYFFKGTNRNSFYISGGLTTYIMDKEWYDFDYNNPDHLNDPSIPKFQNNIGSDKSIHYLGVTSFSFGYQKQLNKRTALQIAPFIEVPLTGIGMGQVDLISTGVQVKLSFSK